MAHQAIIFIDCIIMTVYYVTLFCIIGQFKRRKAAGLLLLASYQILFSIISWIFTYNEDMTGPNTDIDITLITVAIEIIFSIVFFAVFMKGNPFVNYCVYVIADTFNIIMLFLSIRIQEALMPELPLIGRATELSNWPVLFFELLAYGGTIAIALLLVPKLKKLLGKIPDKLLYGILFFYLISEFFLFGIMVFNDEIITKPLIAVIAVVLIITIMALLLFFFTIKLYHMEKLQKELILQEMEQQHRYYSVLHETGVRLRHLKHDLANHQTVMKLADDMDQEASEKYRQQLLTHYQELTEEINKSKLERI